MDSGLPMQNQKFHGICLIPKKIQRSYALIIHWNLEKLVNIFLGTTVHLHLIGRRQMELQNDLMNSDGQNLWHVDAIYAMSKIFWTTPCKRRFEEQFSGRTIRSACRRSSDISERALLTGEVGKETYS